ncbi:pyruvate kinase [Clostridium baratii]|uniref:Pyruvate kinase n=1 Tax=Clostridium baratii TaxID=1561 RepID=A0A174SWU6_9CLOT|nr:pyruvate kinase [Clostridium baratii]CUQ00178.1 pyruvate kinase [Clostridium baratii]
MQKTKIIATLGESIQNKRTLKEIIKNGVNGISINFFNYSYEDIQKVVKDIRDIDKELHTLTSLIAVIKDNKIRTKDFKEKSYEIKAGDYFTFLCGSELVGDNTYCAITNNYLYEKVNIDDIIFIDNGALQFKVCDIVRREIRCKALVSGTISKNKQITIKNTIINSPLINDEIEKDIEFACMEGFDFLSCSSIKTKSDVEKYKDLAFNYSNGLVKVISRIENIDSVNNIDEIVDLSDGIIISRGQLSVTVPVEQIPFIQKDIIKKCNKKNKLVIVSTQILSSMTENPRPTRADVSDVYNLVSDGIDAVILTTTTMYGLYPIETVLMLKKILKDSENNLDYEEYKNSFSNDLILDYDSLMASSVADISNKFPAKAILVGTKDGHLARSISKYRPKAPIIAVTNNEAIGRYLSIQFGIVPFIYKDFEDKEKFIEEARNIAINYGLAKKLDTILILASSNSISFKSDNLKIVTI